MSEEKAGYDPSGIIDGRKPEARKMIVVGPVKIGKTTLACSADNQFLVHTEGNVSEIDCKKWREDPLQTLDELEDVIRWLYENKHPYKRVIVDSIDHLEPIVWQAAADEVGALHIAEAKCQETNYSKGIQFLAPAKWREVLGWLDALRVKKGIDIILISHEKTMVVNPPDGDKYDKSVLKINEYSLSLFEEWADIIARYDRKVLVTKDLKEKPGKSGKAVNVDRRMLYLSGTNPAFLSGSRYEMKDSEVDISQCRAIMEYLLTANENQNEKPKKEKK